MLSLTNLHKEYGDTHLDLCGVQGDNIFLRGYDNLDLVLVHIKSSNLNKSLVIRTKPIHIFPNDEWGVDLIKIPIIESVRVLKHHADKEVVIYTN